LSNEKILKYPTSERKTSSKNPKKNQFQESEEKPVPRIRRKTSSESPKKNQSIQIRRKTKVSPKSEEKPDRIPVLNHPKSNCP
jgi:hypothetical protein